MNFFPNTILDLTTLRSGQIAKLSKDTSADVTIFTDIGLAGDATTIRAG